MAKTDPLDRIVEELRTYLRNRPAPTENDKREMSKTKKAYEYEYEKDINEITGKWVRAATSRQKRSKRWEQVTRLKGDWGLRFFWKSGEVDWEYFEKRVNDAKKVTDKEIKERLAHNDEVRAKYKKDSDSAPVKSRKKTDGMLYFGVCTDRAFNMLVQNDSNIEIDGDFSYRVKWVHDVLSEKLWQYILKNDLLKLKKEERQMAPTEDIVSMTEDLFSSFKQNLPVVRFTDKEFKETTGLKHLRNEQIAELVKKYIHLRITGESKALLNPETGKYREITVIGSVADGLIKKTGNYSQRFHKPEHVYIFSLNFWGFVLFQNYLNKGFTKFPKEYYKLSAEGQKLYRNIAQHRQSTFSPKRIAKIMGYAESTWTARVIERATKHLDKMKASGLIDWKRIDNKDGKMGFHIWRTTPLQLATERQTTESSKDTLL